VPPEDNFAYAHKRKHEIVWMSQNTNQLAPREIVNEAVTEALASAEYELYPPGQGLPELKEEVLKDLGLGPDTHEVLITNGGIEAAYIATRSTLKPGDEVVATDPSFLPIHKQVDLCGARVEEIPVYEQGGILAPERAEEKVSERTKWLLLVDPLNPLGSSYSRDLVKAHAELATRKDVILCHDITYRDFAETHTLATDSAPERTVVIYSFSKSCGLAGLRVGALVAPKEMMPKLLPANTNVLGTSLLSQRAALEMTRRKKEWLPGMIERSRRNQEAIKKCVEGIEGLFLPVYPSHANVFAIDHSALGLEPDEVETLLLREHGVFVRSGRYLSKRFGERFIRPSFTVPEEGIKRFCEALPLVVEKLSGQAGAGRPVLATVPSGKGR
jgi:aspartate/methionine/tyrosine aminotransferase